MGQLLGKYRVTSHRQPLHPPTGNQLPCYLEVTEEEQAEQNNRWSVGARLVCYHRRVGIHFFARASASAICPGVIRMATASRDSAARFSPYATERLYHMWASIRL